MGAKTTAGLLFRRTGAGDTKAAAGARRAASGLEFGSADKSYGLSSNGLKAVASNLGCNAGDLIVNGEAICLPN